MNDREFQMQAEAEACYERGRRYGQDIATIGKAIDGLRAAVAKFEVLNQALPAAVTMRLGRRRSPQE